MVKAAVYPIDQLRGNGGLSRVGGMTRPLAIDLFTGLHGWAEGLVAEGFDVIGFDLEDMCGQFGVRRPDHVRLVIQDVLTLHGSQCRAADLIVASPPCQKFSYMAMPWTKAKAEAAAIRADETGQKLADLTRLFDACFRIQREACEAAGRHIPLVVENVKGAQPWVGRARWSYGSYYLWGDVPALMPIALRQPKYILNDIKNKQRRQIDGIYEDGLVKVPGFRFDGSGRSSQSESVDRCFKSEGMNWSDRSRRGQDFTRIAGDQAIKNSGGSWFAISHNKVPHSRGDAVDDHIKLGGSWFHGYRQGQGPRNHGSKSPARKFASAMIAKIPLLLARHIARTFIPRPAEAA